MLYSLANNGKLSGRADGNVYTRNGRVRAFTVPALVQNSKTALVRNRLATNSSDWNSLSDDERAGWNSATGYKTTDRFGREIPLVGKQLFVSLNNNLANAGIATISECPLPELVDGITSLSIAEFDISDEEMLLTFDASPTNPNVKHLVFATAPQSAGTSRPSSSKYRQIAVMPGTTSTGYDIGAAYVARYGTPPLGSKIYVKLTPILTTTGQAGVSLIAGTTVVA